MMRRRCIDDETVRNTDNETKRGDATVEAANDKPFHAERPRQLVRGDTTRLRAGTRPMPACGRAIPVAVVPAVRGERHNPCSTSRYPTL